MTDKYKHLLSSFIVPGLFFLATLSFPWILNIGYGLIGKSTVTTYGLIWRYFLSGQHPAYLLTETPKPLVCFLYYLLPPWGVYALISFSVAATCYSLSEISKTISGRRLFGVLAFSYCLLGFNNSFRNILFCYWEWLYLGLTVSSLMFLLKKRYLGYAVLMLFSSLVRPESWLYAFFIPVFHLINDSKRGNAILWLPLAGPLLWFGFDYFTFGEFLYSLKMTAQYKDILGVTPLDFTGFSSALPGIVSKAVGPSTLVVAILSLAWSVFRHRRQGEHRHLLLLIIISLPVVFYLLMSVFGNILFMERFIILTNVLLIFYAFLSPNHLKTKPLHTAFLSMGLFAVLTAANGDLNSIKTAITDSSLERQKTALVEQKMPLLKYYADSLQSVIIVPYRRKMAADYFLPSGYTSRLVSFREIVYENAVHGVDIHRYSPAVALFIENDFTGLENGFDFLGVPGTYRLVDYLALKPVACGDGYTIYLLDKDTIWAPPMEFETR